MSHSLKLIPLLFLVTQTLAAGVNGERAYQLLEELCEFGPRVPGTEAWLKSSHWLQEQLEAHCDEVWRQSFRATLPADHPLAETDTAWTGAGFQMFNIVGRIAPWKERRFLLGAHWDSRPFCDHDPDPDHRSDPVLGANDAAGAVTLLIELARVLKEEDPVVGIDIVFFDGEDLGREGKLEEYLLGSDYFARHLPDPRPEQGILLDMCTESDLRIPLEPYSLRAAPRLCNQIWTTAEELGYGSIFVRETGPAIYDDHTQLIEAGVPMVDIIDFDFPEWHTRRDTPDVCDPRSMQIVGDVVLQTIMNLY